MVSTANSKPRVSLLSLLLFVAVVCLCLSHFRTSQQLATSQAELRRIRDEVGYITVDDETQVQVVALETAEPDTWQWRLFLPKGSRYKWNVACDKIVFDSPARKPMQGVSNQPYWETDNRVLVTARLTEIDENNCALRVTSRIGDSENQMAGATLRFSRDKLPTSYRIQSEILGSNGTDVIDPQGPIFLLQRRDMPEPDPTTQRVDNSRPMPGFMIWLSKW